MTDAERTNIIQGIMMDHSEFTGDQDCSMCYQCGNILPCADVTDGPNGPECGECKKEREGE